MGQTLIQRNRTSEAHKLLASLPLMSFSDFPFLIGPRLLYGSVEGLDEAPCLKVTMFSSSKAVFFLQSFQVQRVFFSVQRKLKQFLFFWKRDEFFSGPVIGSPPCIAKESNSLPPNKMVITLIL